MTNQLVCNTLPIKKATCRRLSFIFLMAGVFSGSGLSAAEKLHPWHNVWGNLGDSFSGNNIWYHGSAVAATGAMIYSGGDRSAQNWFQRQNPIGDDVGYAMVVAGWFWQVVPAGLLYFGGWSYGDYESMAAGAAGLQAVATVGAVTMTLKYLTGRRQPLKNGTFEFYGPSGHKRSSNADDFMFFNHNIQNESLRIAWPSGHTSSSFAFVSAMAAFYPEKSWIKWLGYPASLFMAAAMVDYDAHWTSDVIAGALLGHAIGFTIGLNFRNEYNGQTTNGSNSSLSKFHIIRFAIVPRGERIAGNVQLLW